jgi:glycerol-3-phosphate dehydrogenase
MTDTVVTEQFDVIIIGGGINGCATFRDLCLQGLRCLLLEREDFCSGASGASSRLMHGGLKYLETGEFRLVKEALSERNMLFATAPHFVKPLECVVPVVSIWGGLLTTAARLLGLRVRLKDRGLLLTALGLRLYDLYGRSLRATPDHRMVGRRRLRQMLPSLADKHKGAGLYHEGQLTHAERLGLELVLDGLAASPNSRAENHVQVSGRTAESLHYQQGRHARQAQARVIVNAAGAWIDRVNEVLGLTTHLMGGSRGSHLVVDNPSLLQALNGRMIYFGTPDGRVNLLYPFNGRVLVGATDIAQDDPDTAACSPQEVDYLRRAVAMMFPDIPILPDQIVHTFCGVRPLPRADGEVGRVTRDHAIVTLTLPDSQMPVHCLIGGKWTTFRAFSEQVSDRVLADIGRPRRTSTVGLVIGGGRDFPLNASQRSHLTSQLATLGGITFERADCLLDRYGTRARHYCEQLDGHGEIPLRSLPDYTREEIFFILSHEKVGSLTDLTHRRTLIALSGQDHPEVRSELAMLMAEVAGAGVPH